MYILLNVHNHSFMCWHLNSRFAVQMCALWMKFCMTKLNVEKGSAIDISNLFASSKTSLWLHFKKFPCVNYSGAKLMRDSKK